MEKKKLLLVAVSVGVVLMIVIGIPLLIIAPRQNQPQVLQAGVSINNDYTNEPNRFAGIAPDIMQTPLRAAAATVTAAEPQSYVSTVQPYVNEAPPADAAPPPQASENIVTPPAQPAASPQVTTLTVPVPETVAVPNTPVTRVTKPAAPRPAPSKPAAAAQKPAPAAPKEPVKQSAAIKPAVKPPAPQKPARKPSAELVKTNNSYWIQTGAFSTQVRAEGAKESLASKGITSVIDNRDIDGKTWYRVRVGPYVSETEANYWLALVKSIDGFAESQIRLTQAIQ